MILYGNYIFSKFLGEIESVSSEAAIKQAVDNAPQKVCLCVNCAKEFVDSGILDKESVTVDETIL